MTMRLLRQLLYFLGYGTLAVILAAVTGLVVVLQNNPELEIWHEARLDEEFTTQSEVANFEEYLKLEERLFAQLEERVVKQLPAESKSSLNRFTPGSLSHPSRFSRDWNRSYELTGTQSGPGVLLLHGMSDSPYSLRSVALALNQAGAHVVGMRMPGHGTAPVGLTHATWEDMAAAVDLGIAHLRERVGKGPVYLVGYSNGGALSVEHLLHAALDDDISQVDGAVLLSPAIGITPAAAFAVWQGRLGHLLRLQKMQWNSLGPEFDPFKYQSFAVNAGDQSYRLTVRIAELLDQLEAANRLDQVAPILAFQSAVDATVSTAAVLEGLLNRLPKGGHEFVVFDVNRRIKSDRLLGDDPAPRLRELTEGAQRHYTCTVLTNAGERSREVVERRKIPGQRGAELKALGLAWPEGVFSLSHVALPFAPNDPLYGNGQSADPTEAASELALGSLSLRGERGVLLVPPGDLTRQRYNPFHSYLLGRTLRFAGLPEPKPEPEPELAPEPLATPEH